MRSLLFLQMLEHFYLRLFGELTFLSSVKTGLHTDCGIFICSIICNTVESSETLNWDKVVVKSMFFQFFAVWFYTNLTSLSVSSSRTTTRFQNLMSSALQIEHCQKIVSIIIAAKWKVLGYLCHEDANLGHFLFSVHQRTNRSRLQCKWIHGDSGNQNLDRSIGILVCDSFKMGQEPPGHLGPLPSKNCGHYRPNWLDQLSLPVMNVWFAPDQATGYAFVFQLALPTCIIYLIWCPSCIFMSVSLLKQ